MPLGSLGVTSRSFWIPLGSLGTPLGSFGVPSGCPWTPWGPQELPWGSLWGPSGLPRGSLGGALGCLGVLKRFSQICRKLDAQFRANVSICTRLRIESSLPELASGATGARGNGSQSAAQTPPGHTRRGLGLRELNKLPQKIPLCRSLVTWCECLCQ